MDPELWYGSCLTRGCCAFQRKAFYRNGTEMDPTSVDFVPMPGRDPCNKDSGTMKRTVPELLWPQVADGGGGAVRKGENGSSLILGDSRFVQKFTHYKDTHVHPYLQGSLWHPAPNVRDHTHNLAMMTPEEREACYEKMLDKVGECVPSQHDLYVLIFGLYDRVLGFHDLCTCPAVGL